jgi:hypothetical protein
MNKEFGIHFFSMMFGTLGAPLRSDENGDLWKRFRLKICQLSGIFHSFSIYPKIVNKIEIATLLLDCKSYYCESKKKTKRQNGE